MSILHAIAINVKKERFNKNLTQEDLAYKAGLHPNYIGLIERQKRNVSVLALSKIAKALGVKLTSLLDSKQ
ncbi:MAG: helix-turn-helix transcriptional regulator [Endomicrobium sp.]|jgi:transcriptional regulator with XRE-family HTH domain|nr:helix-turn-helix transcriptional regulator [Endomicrobium sp.]